MIIYKYPLERERNQCGFLTVEMPLKARIQSAIVQNDKIVLYAAVFSDVPDQVSPRTIFVAGTGKEVPTEVELIFHFVDTVVQSPFVWHVYAEPSMKAEL